MGKQIVISLLVLFLCFINSTSIHSKVSNGSMYIQFVDQNEKQLSQIQVTLVNVQNKKERSFTSNKSGRIKVNELQVGTYEVILTEHSKYKLYKDVDFEVTPYNIDKGVTLKIILAGKTSFFSFPIHISLYLLFFTLMGAIAILYYYGRKQTFTHFIDNLMI